MITWDTEMHTTVVWLFKGATQGLVYSWRNVMGMWMALMSMSLHDIILNNVLKVV